MRETHWRQILSYIEDRERGGWYYGNRAQFEKRHDEIKEFVISKIDEKK